MVVVVVKLISEAGLANAVIGWVELNDVKLGFLEYMHFGNYTDMKGISQRSGH